MCVCVCACARASLLCLCVSSLAFGNCNGLAVVDYLQKTVLLCMSTLDLYGATDPYQRLTRSPRRNRQSTSGSTHTPLGSCHTHARTQLILTVHPHRKVPKVQSLHSDYCILLVLSLSVSLLLSSLFFISTGVSSSFSSVPLLCICSSF